MTIRAHRWRLLLCILLAVLGSPLQARAHTTSTGLATLTVEGGDLDYRLTVVAGELPEEAGRTLASAADGDPASVERVASLLRERVRFAVDGAECRPGRVRIQGSRTGDGRVMLQFALRCPRAPGRLHVADGLADMFGPHYRTILSVRAGGEGQELVLQEGGRERVLDFAEDRGRDWTGFLLMGAEHVLTGYDHLLFVAALLIGASSLRSILLIATAFTVAHSLTLSLAALGIAAVPAWIIEPAIAASIVWVALENLLARPPVRRWLLAFLFGLVHGFGFAYALQELDLQGGALAAALVGFNLGVEIGQAGVILLALPLLLWLRRSPRQAALARAASLCVAGLGVFWFAERLLA